MSYIELVGTILYLGSVWLMAQRRILTWPIGIASVLLYLALFYQIRLYADALEQLYYLAASLYGWWQWRRSGHETPAISGVRYSSAREIVFWIALTLGLTIGAGAAISQVHLWLPVLFPEPASFPFLDAFTTLMSFTAMWLMTWKRTESWVYWILVDVIGIGLYYVKEVRFVALLYVILLIMAIQGFAAWRKAAQRPVSSLKSPTYRAGDWR